jgi:hypothetical protein
MLKAGVSISLAVVRGSRREHISLSEHAEITLITDMTRQQSKKRILLGISLDGP